MKKRRKLGLYSGFSGSKKEARIFGYGRLVCLQPYSLLMIFDEALNRRLTRVFLGLVTMTAHLPTA
jgi:hypothetical protein